MDSKPNLCYETIHLAEGQMRLFLLRRHWTSVRRLIELIRMWSRYWAHISACAVNTCVCSDKTPYKHIHLRRVQTLPELQSLFMSVNQWSFVKLEKRNKNGLEVFPSNTTTWCVFFFFFILKMGHKHCKNVFLGIFVLYFSSTKI